jgi:uncharacterized protein YkwD
MGDLEEKLI